MKSIKHVNVDFINEMSDGSDELIRDLVNIFIKQVPVFSEQLDFFYEKGDYLSLSRLAHKIKGSAAMMGIEELSKDMKTLENIAKDSKEIEKYPTFISKFKLISTEAIVELNDMLTTLK